ncbi:MAG: hypothetical protein E7224_01740 [Clostridiales bacterium]|nr:hypothetical protein [Clostridiales bacterium]
MILCIALLFFLWVNRPAGTVSGPEHDFITIGETIYVAVKNDPNRDYLYVSSGYEGDFYVKESLVKE